MVSVKQYINSQITASPHTTETKRALLTGITGQDGSQYFSVKLKLKSIEPPNPVELRAVRSIKPTLDWIKWLTKKIDTGLMHVE